MANLDALPIDYHEFDTDIESVFAEEACELLDSHHRIITYYSSDTDTTNEIIATDRFDFERGDGGTLSLRLRMVEQVSANMDAMVFGGVVETLSVINKPSMGLVLEYALFNDEEESDAAEYMSDFQIDWVPYVFVGIFECDFTIKSTLLDAKTGFELSLDDQIRALQALRALRSNVASMSMINVILDAEECNESDAEESIGYVDDSDSSIFRPADYIDGYECDVCGTAFTYCEHNNHRLN